MRTSTYSLVILGLVMSLASCGLEPPTVTTVLVSDSAGIRIVENTGTVVGPDGVWATVDSTPVVEIGMVEGPAPYMLTSIRSPFECPNGDIVLADGGSREIRVFDSTGVHIRSFGGSGEGPGEFQGRPLILFIAPDTVLAWDSALWRQTWFTLDGTVVRTKSFAETRAGKGPNDFLWATVWRINHDGTMVGQKSVPSEKREEGIVKEPLELFMFGGGDSAVRWIRDLPTTGSIRVGKTGMSLMFNPTAGRNWAIQQNPAGIIVMDDPDGRWILSVYDMDGTKRSIIRTDLNTRRKVTPDLVQAARNFQQARPGQPSSMRSALQTAWDQMPVPDSTPMISSVLIDGAGRIWAKRWSGWWEDEGFDTYDVLDGSGRWLGWVDVDRSFGRIDSIGDDHILFVWRDAMDVQRIRRYRLRPARGNP